MAGQIANDGLARQVRVRPVVYFGLLLSLLCGRRTLRSAATRLASARWRARRPLRGRQGARYSTALAVLVPALLASAGCAEAAQREPLRRWGDEALAIIRSALSLPQGDLYAEEVQVGHQPSRPARLWASSVLLSALGAAAQLDRARYERPLRQYADALSSYWANWNGQGGFDVLPNHHPGDRFYDDNAWMALALATTFEVTGDAKYLRRAEDALRFALSGEDDRLDGGIYWREKVRDTKNTASTAPTALAALRLHLLTADPRYFDIGVRLYSWTTRRLQDSDALFSDLVHLDGRVDTTKWSYNSGVMLSTNNLLYAMTGQRQYLKRAEQLAVASERRWVSAESGAFADEAQFAVLLLEGLLATYDQDRNRHWLDVAGRGLTFLHEFGRGASGNYGRYWHRPPSTAPETIRLIVLGAAARGYFAAARYPLDGLQ